MARHPSARGFGIGHLVLRQDRDDPAAAAGLEVDRARCLRKQRVVLADADAVAGLEARAALAHDDLAAGDGLPGEHLHAEALRVGVAAVAAGAEALLVCHLASSSSSSRSR